VAVHHRNDDDAEGRRSEPGAGRLSCERGESGADWSGDGVQPHLTRRLAIIAVSLHPSLYSSHYALSLVEGGGSASSSHDEDSLKGEAKSAYRAWLGS